MMRVALVNYSVEVHPEHGPLVVSHWIIGEERISAATKIPKGLTEEQVLEVLKIDIKSHVRAIEEKEKLGMGNPMGDGTELEPQRV